MGVSISWVAVSGEEPERVLKKLGLARTGEFEELEELPKSYLTCATLPAISSPGATQPGPWFLIFINSIDSPLTSERVLTSLSTNCNVIKCQVEEHVMFSSATSYANGSLVWRVEHDAQQGIRHLSATGSTPPQLREIHDRFMNKQDAASGINANVDYIFEIPLALAKSITSYQHDESDEAFEILRQEGSPIHEAKPWWKVR